ncbi:MAG: hypothetical protein AcusKO_01760 [Acuticoccus sp.]
MATTFTPLASLAGGALIGLAAVLWMGLHGRILGATGLLGGLLKFDDPSAWIVRAALVAGMLVAPALMLAITGAWPRIDVPVGREAILVGGVLVGLGATVGSGCTSGHGVCGMARFSRRSLVATLTFMAAALATVFVVRHVIAG